MINYRRRRKRVESAEPDQAGSRESADVQRALRLGWAIAETFGRLRVYQPEYAHKRNDPNEMPRFSYSNSDLSGAQQLEVSYRRAVELATALNLQPPIIPELGDLLHDALPPVLELEDKRRIHASFEAWSRSAWIQLNVRSAALGRALTYGGSLADTYWYMAQPGTPAFLSGRQSVDALLRPHRIRRMQERMAEISAAFSPDMCDAIGHSLGTWMLDERKLVWARADNWEPLAISMPGAARRTPAQQLHFNLFRQVRTWRDLIFEARQPLDYVSPGFRRRANLAAGTVTILLVVVVALLVGLLVFGAFNLTLVLASNSGVLQRLGGELVEAISIVVSLVSTLVVVTAGLLSRASTAVQQFDTWLENLIIRRTIRRQTTIPWNDLPRQTTD